MTLIEKLEEYHHSLYERWYDNHKHPYDEGAMDAVEKAIAIVKQHSDWISVNERLPEHDGTYPALADGRFGIAKFDPEYNAWLFKNFEVYELMANVTHWMPTPKPPKQ